MKATNLFFLVATSLFAQGDVVTVAHVDLQKYLGLWHELYRVPNSFQDNSTPSKSVCFNTTAEYGVLGEDKISVTNTCKREVGGKEVPDVARAIASVVDKETNAKLSVNFTGLALLRWLGIGDGDYWILGLGALNQDGKYDWALVGSPSRKYGWVLARNSSLPEAETAKIFAIAESNGYQRSQFSPTTRP